MQSSVGSGYERQYRVINTINLIFNKIKMNAQIAFRNNRNNNAKCIFFNSHCFSHSLYFQKIVGERSEFF